MKKKISSLLFLAVFLFILISSFLGLGVNFYTDFLWFKNLDFSKTFWTIFKTKLALRMGVWTLFSLILFINLLFTKNKVLNLIDKLKNRSNEEENIIELNPTSSKKWTKFITKNRINLIYLIISIIIGFLFSNIGANTWETVLKFLNSTSFGITDPLFNNDISFYVFKFPFYQLIYQFISTLIVMSGLAVGIIYLLTTQGESLLNKVNKNNQAKYHLSILISLFFLLKAWGYRLDMFKLLYSQRGVAFGASYTDVHAQLLGLKLLFVIAILLAITVFVNIFIKKTKLIIIGIAGLFIASILLNTVYPGFVQQYQVEPNEIAKESKYIRYNIDFTQKAYGLDKIKEKEFPVKQDLTYQDIITNEATVSNIRLWDKRPLKTTYIQLQGIRSYYDFNDIDIDRYKIDGKLQQVMLGARELNQKLLANQSQTWVNKRLNYTHGFGLAMSPVNKVTESGLPEFLIKNVPPQSNVFNIKQPRIYYGELTNEYVIANTNNKEFDYPQGNKNKYINYGGTGGVKLDSGLKRLAFAFKYGTLKILLNNDIQDNSRLMFERNIKKRVRKIAPFLKYDNDPYLVIGKNNKLYWIQDAYTTTNMYPYSEPQSWGNYIRNSVKVVINAYTGKAKFYVINNDDPVIQTYNKIFPELFTSYEKMPQNLKEHMRYPKDLFTVQAKLYNTYHMEDPNVFYNKEDLWNIPQENYAGDSITMKPYYVLMSLPESKEQNFLLMSPFTPVKKNNMISWLAAKSDNEDYGELILYRFPKRKLVYGPMQIEARVDQESEISQQLSLWDQRGSRVIRGNLLTIPIKNSLLYIEPVYLQAEQSQLPELKRVILAYDEEIVMAKNLDSGLKQLFNVTKEDERKREEPERIETDLTIKELINNITSLYSKTQEKLKEGNWTEYGQLLEKLEKKLNQLKEKTK